LSHDHLPQGVWQYVFPANRQLLALTYLGFSGFEGEGVAALNVQDLPSTWGAADLSCLVSSCPNLCNIHAVSLQHGLHVSELHKLTQLSSIYIHYAVGGAADLERSIQGLAAVTQLEHLRLNLDRHSVEVSSLLALTNLTALTTLECCLDEYRPSMSDRALGKEGEDDVFYLEVSSVLCLECWLGMSLLKAFPTPSSH
jgi:hypothetical protein